MTMLISNYSPDLLHAVGECLDDSRDVDRVDVPLLQLVKQHVHMWQDLVKQGQEKAEIFFLKHHHKAPCLSNSNWIKVTRVADSSIG